MTELHDLSLCETRDAIRNREFSSLELIEHLLTRIEKLQPRLNCFIRVDADHARQKAMELDKQLHNGDSAGPLHGIPLAHKDMFYTAGKVTTCASRIRKSFVPQVTSTLLERLDFAGAINLGTLNMTEFAFGPTGHNAIWGDCKNPWNLDHITGGSSSGSGSAVAARLVMGSLGSDSGGSIRLPSSMCGIVGLKPTLTRLSLYGAMGLSFSIDTPGPMTRTVADCALMMDVISGADPNDPYCSELPTSDYSAVIGRDIKGMRIGVPANYFYEDASDEIKKIMQDSLKTLESLGAEIVEINVPYVEYLSDLSRAILYPEGTAKHIQWLRDCPEQYSPQIKVRAATGFGIPSPVYHEALNARATILKSFVEEVFDKCEVLHTPMLSFSVPSSKETDVSSGSVMWKVIGSIVHCTAPFNYLGLPAMSVPAGFTLNSLPSSFQLVARPFAETSLLQVASAYEACCPHHKVIPNLAS